MPRRKPTSTKQLKADRQLKRAVKRGDAPPPDPALKKPKRPRKGGQINRSALSPSQSSQNAIETSRKLQSSFIKLPPSFLEDTKLLANSLILPRPIKPEAALLPTSLIGEKDDAMNKLLTCPKRPKWRFDMSKKEVETNEEGLHMKWIAQTDKAVSDWQNGPEENKPEDLKKMPRSPTYYERNLEVWRQLWRVVEISQIILVLLDSRCPLLHFPPSLSTYLSDRKVILVLTKVDISGHERAASWTRYFNHHHPGLRIVQVESYTEKTESAQHQGRTMYEPHLPKDFRERLVQAIRDVHAEMMEPPEKIKGDIEKMKKWKPSVKTDIDWEAVLKAGGGQVGSIVGGASIPRPKPDDDDQAGESTDQVPEFLTVGLIGQPNVGKSSLLNALFGAHKVRASKTPGKTKHFQTLFWTSDVRIVDCPGLVMPNFVPMEMQVLSGILPISRISAIPACIHFSAQYLPLERIFDLTHPSVTASPVEDKRTWRDGVRPSAAKEEPLTWTAMDILTAYADKKGWVTAKAGRPDVGRAGNALLRCIAEGKIGWAFWPPDTDLIGEEANGIWIPHATRDDDDSDLQSEEEDDPRPKIISDESSGSEESGSEAEEDDVHVVGIGRFGALGLNDEQ